MSKAPPPEPPHAETSYAFLTQEDRRRIYEEERARIEAQEQLAAERQVTGTRRSKQNESGAVTCLVVIVFFGMIFWAVSASGPASSPAAAPNDPAPASAPSYAPPASSEAPPPAPAPVPEFQLQKGSESFIKEYDYCTVSGEVKNISSEPIQNVQAVTTFYDKDGNVIKTADALIDYNPIMPGQTSPYKTMTPDNPLIQRERTSFQVLMGGEILTKEPPPREGTARRSRRHRHRG